MRPLYLKQPFHPNDFGIPQEHWEAAIQYREAFMADVKLSDEKLYEKGKRDGRAEAMADLRELLGVAKDDSK